MWLLPALSLVSNGAARIYYRLTIAGEPAPAAGPVLLVANHPNSLLDPILVAAAAGRPVRFLAKAPLFTDRAMGWLVRASGAIPVYRQADEGGTTDGNVDMFRAVHAELEQGAAIGIFPEGLSHSEPELAKLKTGAARIALGTARRNSRSFPIVPVGLVFRRKDIYRSEALVVRGRSIAWDDIAGRSAEDRDAVRELTDRIEEGMRRVTVNLEQWEDRPLVECAEAIWTAELGGGGQADTDPAARVARLHLTTSVLSQIRHSADARWGVIVRDVTTHCRRLRRLRLNPKSLVADVSLRASVKWSVRRLPLLGLPALAVAGMGYALFWLPRYVTGKLSKAAGPDHYQRSTYAFFIGIVVYAAWIAVWEVALWWSAGYLVAAATLILWPVVGLLGLSIRERWQGSWVDVRSFFLLRSRRKMIELLKRRQHELAVRLEELLEEFQVPGVRNPPP